ncbi:M23 family metallopeptidase [Dermacoccaceae bacterium W4C1]
MPALAAASLTVAAAGTAVATEGSGPARANTVQAGFKDTTQWNAQAATAVSRSTAAQRAGVVKAQANVKAKAKLRANAAEKARLAADSKARKAAVTSLAGDDANLSDYTQPAPEPVEEPTETTAAAETQSTTSSQQSSTTSVSRSTSSRSTSTERTSRSSRSTAAATSTDSDDSSYSAPSASGSWVRPVSGGTRTSGFGMRWGRLHAGIDYAVPVGTPLRSMNNGTVVKTGWYGGQGNRVVVRFANGVEAVYAHMSSISVSPGQSVGAGQTLGLSGNTGNSTGPHLHLEIHIGGSPINPAGWLAARGI